VNYLQFLKKNMVTVIVSALTAHQKGFVVGRTEHSGLFVWSLAFQI